MVAATTAVVSSDAAACRPIPSRAGWSVQWPHGSSVSIPADADRQQSPLEGQADVWREAREHYLDHCAVCHGRDAKGNTDMGANMHPKVPDRLPPRFSVAATGRCSTSFRMASDGPVCLRGRKSTRPRTREAGRIHPESAHAHGSGHEDRRARRDYGRKACEGGTPASTSSLTVDARTVGTCAAVPCRTIPRRGRNLFRRTFPPGQPPLALRTAKRRATTIHRLMRGAAPLRLAREPRRHAPADAPAR